MADILEAPSIGHNRPPEPTFYELAEKKIADVYGEAKLWLDGARVDSKELADGIGNLLKLIRDARKFADEQRKVENEPFDKGKAEVQARYNPLLQRADLAAQACKAALQPWLDAEDRRIEEEARKAREEAEAKQRAAQEAFRQAQEAADLRAREDAERLLKDAKKADKAATKAEKQTATAGGAFGRAIGMRTVYTPIVTDATQFARYVWTEHKLEMSTFLDALAKRLFAAGMKDMPGVAIAEEKQPV